MVGAVGVDVCTCMSMCECEGEGQRREGLPLVCQVCVKGEERKRVTSQLTRYVVCCVHVL